MTDSLDTLSPAWRKTLEAIESRQSSPVLLPLAVGAIVDIFEAGTNDGAVIRFDDYEKRFRALADRHKVKLKSGPWMPYLALAGPLGVLTCLDQESGAPADFGGRRPKGRYALLRVSKRAAVVDALAKGLADSDSRKALDQWASQRVASSGS